MSNDSLHDLTFAVLLARLGYTGFATDDSQKSPVEKEFDSVRHVRLGDLDDYYLTLSIRQDVSSVARLIERVQEVFKRFETFDIFSDTYDELKLTMGAHRKYLRPPIDTSSIDNRPLTTFARLAANDGKCSVPTLVLNGFKK